MSQETFNVILAALLMALLTSIGWVIRQQVNNARAFRVQQAESARVMNLALQEMAQSLAVLNTGASAGARAAINDLREEMRRGFHDHAKDIGALRNEHDSLAERHHSLNGTVVQLAERVNGTQQSVHEIRRDIYAVRDRSSQSGGAPS